MDSFDCYFAYRMFRVIAQLCVLIAQFITLYTRICIPHSANESLWSILHSTRNPTARRERSSSSDMERYCWYVSVHVYKFHYILLEWSICVGTAYSPGLEGPLSFAVMAGTQVVDHAAYAAPGVYCFIS